MRLRISDLESAPHGWTHKILGGVLLEAMLDITKGRTHTNPSTSPASLRGGLAVSLG